MAQGLQVWDEIGVPVLDSSTQTTTIVKVLDVAANSSLSYTDPVFSANNFFYAIAPFGRWTNVYVKVVQSGNTITVTTTNLTGTAKVVLGVY